MGSQSHQRKENLLVYIYGRFKEVIYEEIINLSIVFNRSRYKI